MKFEIKCRFSAKILFECEAESIKFAVEKAVSVGANLYGANLYGANLDGANLTRANLTRANLDGANLTRANLDGIKKEFFEKLTLLKNEVVGLYKALLDGKINGSAYTGECACFVGTCANVRGVSIQELSKLTGIVADSYSPTERWFVAIRQGDTPEGNQVSALTKEWIEQFAKENSIPLPTRTVTWS